MQPKMDYICIKLIGALLLCWSSVALGQVPAPPKPAVFIFGDSAVDPGNNNYLPASLAKANFAYNGIDFPGGVSTGRFCNGRTVVDVVCDIMGTPFLPPYLAPATKAGQGILQGVNYASAAGGILDATGGNYIQRIGMNQQINFFQSTLSQLQAQLGITGAANLVATSLCTVVIGSNDFINNYLLSDTNTKNQYDVRQYNVLLLNNLNQQLTELYNLGFRKFTIAEVGPLGCIPQQLAIAKTQTCIQSTNDQVQDFNAGLASLLTQLNNNLPQSQFLIAKVFDAVISMISNPASYGFTVNNAGCCGAGLYNGQLPCNPTATPCPDRTKFVFWDPFHPTQAANDILASGLWNGGTDKIFPINIQQLLNL